MSLNNAIAVYPNPGAGLYNVTSQVPDARFELFSLSGMRILGGSLTEGKGQLDIHDHAAGIYFLKVYYGSLSYTIKLVKY